MQQTTGPSAEAEYKIEDIENAVLSASGNLVYSTNSYLPDHNIYRLNTFNAHREQLWSKDLYQKTFAVDASGNVLISSSFKTLYWPVSSLTAEEVSVRIGASSSLVSGADGSWFFAIYEGIIRFDSAMTLVRWRPDAAQETEKVCQHSAPIGAIATSEDGRFVISADADASLSGPLANTRSQYRATRIAVYASRRNAAAGTWTSEVLFEFRAEVPAVGVTREGHAFAASIDGSLQFAFASGEKMRIETGEVIEWTVADPARPLIAFAAHEQEEITVFAIEPDAAGCSTLLPFRRDQHGEFFHRQLEHQIRQNAPAERIERFALKSAQHFEARKWSSSQILEALQPTAPFAQQSAVLLNVEAAFTVVQSDSGTSREFQERLIRLMGSDYNGLLSQRIRWWALDGCDKLGMMMIEPLLALFDEQSWRGCVSMLTALQLIASQDQRVDRLIQATILEPSAPDLPDNRREVREQTFQWFLERQWGLITQLTNRGHLIAASTCFRRWQQLAAMQGSENLPSQIRHSMRQALTGLASALAGSGELSEAIQWLNECHKLTPHADSAEYSIQLARSEATVMAAVSEAAGMEFNRSEDPKKLISSIDEYLDDKDQDLEARWWIRNFHAVSDEFTGQLLNLNRLADAWAWMQHATWYFDLDLAAFSDREQAHRDAAYRARNSHSSFPKQSSRTPR
jgi:hypothetical protein